MKVELLAPAGSYESFTAALNAGADAVYMGGTRFGARAFADNPDERLLLEAIDECHIRQKHLYLTINTLLKERELSELYEYLSPYYERGLDAVIVQDMGVFSFIRREFPDLPIHASTQMTVTGAGGAKFLRELGAARVVTSRELSLKEIRKIHEETDIEIESFVHGALCYCYSGQCLMSSLIGGRSGNRGRCAQPCRLPYSLYKDQKQISRSQENYLLSPKDMCTLDLIGELISAGVYSFKIEGRMKKPAYTAGVVRLYRKYLDFYLTGKNATYSVTEDDKRELLDLYNRGGFSSGYYLDRNDRKMISLTRPNHAGTEAGKLESQAKGKRIFYALEDLNSQDILEISGKHGNQKKYELTLKDSIKKGQSFSLKLPDSIPLDPGSAIYRTKNTRLVEQLEQEYVQGKFQEKINGKLILLKNSPAILEITMGKYSVKEAGETVCEALNQPLSIEKVKKQVSKTGNSPFIFESLEIQMDADIFLPVQALNDLRRNSLEALKNAVLNSYLRTSSNECDFETAIQPAKGQKSEEIRMNISLENLQSLEELLKLPQIDTVYLDGCCFHNKKEFLLSCSYIDRCHQAGKKCFYIMPHIFREDTKEYYNGAESCQVLNTYDGILLRSMEELIYLKILCPNQTLAADHNLYTFNHEAAVFFQKQGISYDTAPLEENVRELSLRGCTGSELFVYGHLPVMVSAQCLQKTTEGCIKKSGIVYLQDRKKKFFPVRTNCQFCYNTIYNGTPLLLGDNLEEIKSLNPKSVRLGFTFEKKEDIMNITKSFIEAFYQGKKNVFSLSDFTRGHFKRGVE